MNPWFGISLVILILAALMSGLRLYKRRFDPHPELVRKLLHVGMGLVALTFPCMFAETWPVLLLAAVTVPGLYALRRARALRQRFGGVIDGVNREESLGEIYFPVGVAGLFALSGGDVLLYSIPLLLLALADAVAALIGLRYGQAHYGAAEGEKSWEGSMAFFIVAFFSVHVPLLLFSPTGRAESLLIALILGLLMMMVEAIAWQGLDNLFIPVGGYLLLETFLGLSLAGLLARLVITLALVAFVFLWRRQANLNESALLGAALVGYLSWSLAGWHWFIPPFLVFIGHILLMSGDGGIEEWRNGGMEGRKNRASNLQPPTSNLQPSKPPTFQPYTIHAVASVGSGGLFWLGVYSLLHRSELFYPFTLTFAAHLAIMAVVALRHRAVPLARPVLLAGSILRGWLLLFIPFLWFGGLNGPAVGFALVALAGVALAAVAFYRLQPFGGIYPTDTARWLRQAACALAASLVALGPLYWS